MRACILSLLGLLVVTAAISGAEKAGTPDKPLNVLMILADDLGWSDTCVTGETSLYETPNLERLAKRGMTFRHAYAASPLCSPTRASILTGQSPARLGITSPVAHIKQAKPSFRASVAPKSPPGNRASNLLSVGPLNSELPTLGKLIQQAGYATGHFGKWHLGHPPHSPLEHGFDIDIPHWPGPGPGRSFLAPWDYPNYDQGKPGEHIEDRMATEAANWMKKQAAAGKPFYAHYWQFSVHAPFDAKPEVVRKYAAKVTRPDDVNQGQHSPTYAAMVESLDDAVGTLLDALDEAGVSDHTLIVFYSDNGGNEYNLVFERDAKGAGYLSRPTDNAPLRGGKATIYEGGIRVPAVIAWPGVVEAGAKSDARIQSTDLYPTILNALGIGIPKAHALDGMDLGEALAGKAMKRPGGMVTYFPHAPGVPEWLPPCASVHDGDWKLIRIFFDGEDGAHRHLLYNLKDDIGETTNLAAQHPDMVDRMDALIERHLAETRAVVPAPNSAFKPEAYQPELIGVQDFPPSRLLATPKMGQKDRKEAEALLEEHYHEVIGKPAAKPEAKSAAKPKPGQSSSARSSKKPNVILIYGDDVGWGDVGCYGATKIPTPHIDRLATQGLRFSDAHCASSTCTPSRYSLLTGELPFRKKGTGIASGTANRIIDPDQLTLADVFKMAGYTTAVIGKWHLGLDDEPIDWNGEIKPGPESLGFDHHFIIPATNDRLPTVYMENNRIVGLDPEDPITVVRGNYEEPIPDDVPGTRYPIAKLNPEAVTAYPGDASHSGTVINGLGRIGKMKGGKAALFKDEDIADDLVREANKFIRTHADEPFFLFFSANDIHAPRWPHSRFRGKSGHGLRGDAMVSFDWSAGALMKLLDELKLADNTIVIVTSDNGPVYIDGGYQDGCEVDKSTGEVDRGHDGSGPWRGGKYQIHEGGTRVPFILRWPGKVKPGVSDALVTQTDLLASFAGLLDVELPAYQAGDSRNALDALLGKSDKGADFIVQTSFNKTAIRAGSWKYIADPTQLYDLSKDPAEQHNRIDDEPSVAAELKTLLDGIRRPLPGR